MSEKLLVYLMVFISFLWISHPMLYSSVNNETRTIILNFLAVTLKLLIT